MFAYEKPSRPIRLLRLLIRAFGQIDLHNLSVPLIEQSGFDLDLYNRMVRECFPQGYIVRNEQIAYKLNHRKRDSKPTTTKAKKRPNQKRKSSK